MNHQALGITNIRQMRKQFNIVDKLLSCLDPPLYAETDDGAGAVREIPCRPVMILMRGKPG